MNSTPAISEPTTACQEVLIFEWISCKRATNDVKACQETSKTGGTGKQFNDITKLNENHHKLSLLHSQGKTIKSIKLRRFPFKRRSLNNYSVSADFNISPRINLVRELQKQNNEDDKISSISDGRDKNSFISDEGVKIEAICFQLLQG